MVSLRLELPYTHRSSLYIEIQSSQLYNNTMSEDGCGKEDYPDQDFCYESEPTGQFRRLVEQALSQPNCPKGKLWVIVIDSRITVLLNLLHVVKF